VTSVGGVLAERKDLSADSTCETVVVGLTTAGIAVSDNSGSRPLSCVTRDHLRGNSKWAVEERNF